MSDFTFPSPIRHAYCHLWCSLIVFVVYGVRLLCLLLDCCFFLLSSVIWLLGDSSFLLVDWNFLSAILKSTLYYWWHNLCILLSLLASTVKSAALQVVHKRIYANLWRADWSFLPMILMSTLCYWWPNLCILLSLLASTVKSAALQLALYIYRL
ncbi:hypothetical protein QVD17_07808 [Tagetes erecta]|uniref:Uncharacterized protein n=1 Tax=Tagetes erecta TaxID=13708 RepID=A0AAD8L1Z3_TARER|nr:hypothetical protein QVD17_07808 [Tagetes erecta]